MDKPAEKLRVLILEDVPTDAELVTNALRRENLDITDIRVDTEAAFTRALQEFNPHIVLADFRLPSYSGRDALEYTRRAHPQIPVIMVTGSLGDEAAVELLKLGAKDYVLKDHLARLAPAVKRALSEEKGIRNRKLAEGKYQTLFNEALDGIVLLDCETGCVTDCNPEFERQTGRTLGQLKYLTLWELLPAEKQDAVRKKFLETREIENDGGKLELQRPDGAIVPVDIVSKTINIQGMCFIQSIVRDISERKHAEDALHRANRALRTLSAGNLALVRAASEDELLRAVTGIIVEQGGYSLASVCYADDNPEKSITLMAWSGTEDNYRFAQRLSWANTAQNQSSIAKAIRSGATQICHDNTGGSGLGLCTDAMQFPRYASTLVLPLRGGGRIFGGLSIYSPKADAFDEDEVQLLEELSNDLAYGIITLRTRIEHEQHATILRQSLEQSIQTIAGTLEARDPYTAGHQRRVAELATAIAQEMGLPEEQVKSIHFAAIIHDVGKIHIPAEILSKPGKLSEIEFMLIKTHPQAGYDILKDVKFPWPITDLILQHHEKLDGSGYPQGLKAEQIRLESRILTVADVVEAMSSHRPYRPSLGIKAALSEIERGRGSVYDPAVVDACLKLFAETGFGFSSDAR